MGVTGWQAALRAICRPALGAGRNVRLLIKYKLKIQKHFRIIFFQGHRNAW